MQVGISTRNNETTNIGIIVLVNIINTNFTIFKFAIFKVDDLFKRTIPL